MNRFNLNKAQGSRPLKALVLPDLPGRAQEAKVIGHIIKSYYLAGKPISKASIFKSDPHPSKMRPYRLLLGVLVRMRTGEISNSRWG